jgi:endonuclease/exonuclease/phosphatase (EEP) superfamily protein YafD
VILLQEAGRLDPDTAFAPLRDEYPHLVDLTGTTLIMLSRFPVNGAQTVDLGGWFIDRAEVETEIGSLAVYNVHMDWPLGDESQVPALLSGTMFDLFSYYSETNRNRLIHSLLAILSEETLPYVVAGDFNTSDNSLIYSEIAAVMGDSYRETNTGLGNTFPAAGGDDPIPALVPALLRLDYIWHSDALRAISSEIGPNLGSDHLPVIATLAFDETSIS